MKKKLKLMLEEIINENTDQAAVHFHSYISDQLREMMGGEMPSDEESDEDETSSDEDKDEECSCDDKDEDGDDGETKSDEEYEDKSM